MYRKWGAKQGYEGRIVEKYPSKDGGFKIVTLEFESEYAYGYLSGERGVHYMIKGSHNDPEVCSSSPFIQPNSSPEISHDLLNACHERKIWKKRKHLKHPF